MSQLQCTVSSAAKAEYPRTKIVKLKGERHDVKSVDMQMALGRMPTS